MSRGGDSVDTLTSDATAFHTKSSTPSSNFTVSAYLIVGLLVSPTTVLNNRVDAPQHTVSPE